MLTMAVGQSDDVDPAIAVDEAIDQCRAAARRADAAGGHPLRRLRQLRPALLDAVRDAFPGIELIGSTSAAEMSSVAGYREDSVALAVFASDDVDLAVGLGADVERTRSAAAARTAVAQALAGTTKEPKVCIVLTEGLNGQRALRGTARRRCRRTS